MGMNNILVLVVLLGSLGRGAFGASASDFDFTGIVKLNNCSGALVRYDSSADSDAALVLTNGHCVTNGPLGGMMKPGEVKVNEKSSRAFQLLSRDGKVIPQPLRANRLLYATMTGTDLALYELQLTFQQIRKQFGIEARVLDRVRPSQDEPIQILSGYFQIGYACTIDAFIFQLLEAGYTMKDSVRYSEPGCDTKPGTSGSPVLSARTGRVIAVNNTGNTRGQMCTMDNPCEVDESGQRTVLQGASYGQQTFWVYSCLNADRKLDLALPGCELHRP